MDKKRKRDAIALFISCLLFAAIALVLVFFGSDGGYRIGPVARGNIVMIVIGVLTVFGFGIFSKKKPREFQMGMWGNLGLSMLAIFAFLGLMVWLSSDLDSQVLLRGMGVAIVIAIPLTVVGIDLRRHAQTQKRFAWGTVMTWIGIMATIFAVASLIKWLIIK